MGFWVAESSAVYGAERKGSNARSSAVHGPGSNGSKAKSNAVSETGPPGSEAKSSPVHAVGAPGSEAETIELFSDRSLGAADSADPVRGALRRIREPGAAGRTSEPPRADDLHASGPIPESIDELAREITTLAQRISRATHRMLELIAAFDRRGGWKAWGHRSCAHWLHVETGLSLGAAREKVRTALALTAMPQTSEAMKQGDLPYSKVRAMSRAAEDMENPKAEARLVAKAKRQTTAQVEQMIRGFKHLGGRVSEMELERRRHASRYLSIRPDGNGMYQLRGTLPAEVGALLMRAVEAAGDALYQEERARGRKTTSAPSKSRKLTPLTPAQRRADAMGLLAERAMAVGFGGAGPAADHEPVGGRDDGVEDRGGETIERAVHFEPADHESEFTGRDRGVSEGGAVSGESASTGGAGGIADKEGEGPDQRSEGSGQQGGGADRSDAAARRAAHGESACACHSAPLSGTRAERYQVLLHVEPSTLQREGEIGRSHLEDGTRVPAETSRRLSCDAGVVTVASAEDGSVLRAGRRTRTIPPAVRRALQVRDGGCRFPGCGLRFTEAHHLVHWADGGSNRMDNLVLLCRHHHRCVHEEGFGVRRGPDGALRFFDPEGRAISPEGREISPDGRATSPEGRATSPEGRAINPGGRAISLGQRRDGS